MQPAGTAKSTLEDLLSDARRHARDLAVRAGRRPIIVGHSNGALLALALAGTGDASGVVLVAPAPPPSIGGLPVWVRKMLFSRIFGKNWQGRAICFDPRWPFQGDTPPAALTHSLCPDSGPAMLAALDAPRGSAFDPRPPLSCRAVVIAGKRDRLVPIALARRLARRFGAELIVRPSSGHWLIAEDSSVEAIVRSAVSAGFAGAGAGERTAHPPTGPARPVATTTNQE